jgi:heme O synthase-like polyprenyltransferase
MKSRRIIAFALATTGAVVWLVGYFRSGINLVLGVVVVWALAASIAFENSEPPAKKVAAAPSFHLSPLQIVLIILALVGGFFGARYFSK